MLHHHFLHQFFCVGIDDGIVHVFGVDQQIQVIGILHAVDSLVQVAFAVFPLCLDIGLETFQIVFRGLHVVQRIHHVIDGRFLIDGVVVVFAVGSGRTHKGLHQCAEVRVGLLDSQRIGRERLFLDGIDIGVESLGNRKYQGNADDADASGKGSEHGSAFFGEQVFQRQGKGCAEGHGRLFQLFACCDFRLVRRQLFLIFRLGQRLGIVGQLAVQNADDTGRVLLRQFRVVGDHDDQAVFGDLLENFHDLNAGLRVQRTGRLVSQDDIRIVDQRTGNSDTLHLSAGHLAGLFGKLTAQSDILQRFLCTLFPL